MAMIHRAALVILAAAVALSPLPAPTHAQPAPPPGFGPFDPVTTRVSINGRSYNAAVTLQLVIPGTIPVDENGVPRWEPSVTASVSLTPVDGQPIGKGMPTNFPIIVRQGRQLVLRRATMAPGIGTSAHYRAEYAPFGDSSTPFSVTIGLPSPRGARFVTLRSVRLSIIALP